MKRRDIIFARNTFANIDASYGFEREAAMTHGDFSNRDRSLKNMYQHCKRNGPFNRMATEILHGAHYSTNHGDYQGNTGQGGMIRFDGSFYQITAGVIMEDTTEVLKKTNEVVKETLAQLEKTVNEMQTLRDYLLPQMNLFIQEIQAKRMTLNRELTEVMQGMRDVRKFFLDREHTDEKKRLEEFVSLCERLQKLQRDGFLDAVADLMLHLEGASSNVRK